MMNVMAADQNLPKPTPPQPPTPPTGKAPVSTPPPSTLVQKPVPSAGGAMSTAGSTPTPQPALTKNQTTPVGATPAMAMPKPVQMSTPTPTPSPTAAATPASLPMTPPKPGTPIAPTPPQPPTPSKLPPSAISANSGVTAPPPPPAGANKPGGASVPPVAPKPTTAATPANASAPAKQPIFAKLTQSPLKFLPIIGGVLLVVVVIVFAINQLLGSRSQPTTSSNTAGTPATTVPTKQTILTYWGLWEPEAVMEQLFTEFSKENPGVIVQYSKQSHQEYRERVQSAIASGSGPDLFRFHASWTPMLKAELAPLPTSIFKPTEYTKEFYPAATQQLQANGQLVGIPLMYDGLALYYNKDILAAAGAKPPASWAELRQLAVQLTVRDSQGKLQRGGVALGNASNVEHFSDVIGLLLLQNGADPSNPTSRAAQDALTFYTNFAKVDKVWDETLPSSTVAFARGDVAMMFAPSWRAHEVLALNPGLKFEVAPLPKLAESKLAWASFWAEGVSAQSKNKELSWKLLEFLSREANQQKLYTAASASRAFGEPYSRVDNANSLATDPYVGAYIQDAPSARSWYLNSFTHDNGINDQLITYYTDAVNSVLGGEDVAKVMETVSLGTTQVLRQYGVPSTAATTTVNSSETN